MLWVVAAVTMTLGNIMALIQDNLKRILAYSGIAHAGYMLLGLVAATAYAPTDAGPEYLAGLDSLLVYLVAYALMTLGVFAVIIYVGHAETVDDLAGVGRTHPVAALCLAVSLLSLIGLPLTAGFAGKLLLFFGLIDAADLDRPRRHVPRAGRDRRAERRDRGGVLSATAGGLLSADSPLNPEPRAKGSGPIIAAFLCAVGTLAIGVYPKPLVDAAKLAAPAIAR